MVLLAGRADLWPGVAAREAGGQGLSLERRGRAVGAMKTGQLYEADERKRDREKPLGWLLPSESIPSSWGGPSKFGVGT